MVASPSYRRIVVRLALEGPMVNYSRPVLAEVELGVDEPFFHRDTAAALIGNTIADLLAGVAPEASDDVDAPEEGTSAEDIDTGADAVPADVALGSTEG